MGYNAQNNHNFKITIILSRITTLIEAIWWHTYFISLPFASLHCLFLLVVHFLTLSALCTTSTYVLLLTKVNSNNLWWSKTGWDRWLSGYMPINRPQVQFRVETLEHLLQVYSFHCFVVKLGITEGVFIWFYISFGRIYWV